MEDALELEGFLMKEKSKISRLHGLTGDMNKRYFRIRSVEGSPELALCYSKNITDSEVRGWIYLKDVTEIAENQDTIILTSSARTLHLYAETRANHNAWVTGLAKLCPDAVKILGREGSCYHVDDSAALVGNSFASDQHNLPNEATAADNVFLPVDPQPGQTVDNEEISLSTNENDARSELFGTPLEAATWTKRRDYVHSDIDSGGQQETGEHRASQSTPRGDSYGVRGRNEERDNDDPGQVGLRGDTRLNYPRDECVKLGSMDKKGRKSFGKEERRGCRALGSETRGAKLADTLGKQHEVLETVGSPTSSRRSAEDTPNGRNTQSPTRVGSRCCIRNFEASCNKSNGRENVDNKRETQRSEQRSTRHPDFVRDTTPKAGSYGDKEVVVLSGAHGNETRKQPTPELSDSEKVETMELRETICTDDEHTRMYGNSATGHVQQEVGDSKLPKMLEISNQDEDKELDEQTDIDLVVPIEVKAWEGSHQWQTATSRLHRHISRSEADASGTVNLPPPKEFLASTSLEPLVKVPKVGGAIAKTGQSHGPESTRPGDIATTCTRRRTRRRAADLEWNDGGETPDRPSCTEDKLTQPAACEPVDFRDFEGDESDDLELDIEKQRRRAAAAVLALQVAAKEADEEMQVQSEALGDLTRRGSRYPSPVGPPPAALLRKTRRGNAGPPSARRWSRVAPAKISQSPARDNFTGKDCDDGVKTPSHGSPVAG
ncbi:unnamed protein product, partial [Hapterophycus canaliculatus]